jgi:ParB-like chromosome segregation protein Spo0J
MLKKRGAGRGRLLAARKLGLAEAPVIVLDRLSQTQRRALVLAGNRLSELAGWDDAVLAAELAALEAEGVELGVIGFTEAGLADLLAGPEQAPAADAEEEVPLPATKALTQSGDLWLVGPHRILCGDCRDAAVAARLFEGRKANVGGRRTAS